MNAGANPRHTRACAVRLEVTPTQTMQSYAHSTGVEAILTNGQTVQRTWSFYAGGIGAYAVSQGGGPPIFFTAPMIPDVSQANPGAYAPVQVAMPLSQHPCAIRFALPGRPCTVTNDASGLMGVDAQGMLQLEDPSILQFVTPGTYCLAVYAEWGSSIVLDSAVLSFEVVPRVS